MNVLDAFLNIIFSLFPVMTTEVLPPLFRTVLEVSLTMAAVIALLLLLRPLLQKRYRAGWMYWVWLLVALRLAVPLNLSLPRMPVSLMAPSTTFYQVYAPEGTYRAWEEPELLPAVNAEAAGGSAVEELHTPVARLYTLSQVAVLIWSMGVCVVLLWESLSYARFRRRVRRWRSEEEDGKLLARFDALKSELGVKRLTLARCSAVSSPMVTGFLRPTLLLPSGDASEAVLRHELIHAKRHDLWYKLLLVVVRAVHWFNPLVWLMERQASQDLELSCDEAVVASRDENFRADYGRAILAAVDSGAGKERAPLTSYFNGGKKAMLERLKSILDSKAKRRGAVALTLAAVLTITASAVCAISPPTRKVEGGTYSLSIPTDIISCTRTEVMPDDNFPTSYYETHFRRYSGSGHIRRLSIPGFADMSFAERAEALRPTDKALGEFEFFDYVSPGGLIGIKGVGGWNQVYYFCLGGDGVLEFWLSLGAKGTGHHGAYFTQAEADAMLSSLMIGNNHTSNPKGNDTLSASYRNTETLWLLWDTSKQNPVLLDTISTPAEPRVIGGVVWSMDGKWAAVPSSDGNLKWNCRILGVGKEGFEQDFAVTLDPTMLSSDDTPIPDTLELRAMEFVNLYADYPALTLSYSLLDTEGNLQSGTLTYTPDITLTGFTPVTDVEQNPPYLPTVWQDGSHTLSLSLPSGSTVSAADAQGIRTFTDATGAYLGRVSKVAPADARNQSYQASTQTHFSAWLDESDGRCYQLELTQATLPPFLINRMVESLTMDGNAVEFYYENQIIK